MTGQIVKANWYKYDESGANPTTACESGAYYYFYDALGNPDRSGPSANDFLPMDQSGPKEHLTGKMYDTVTGLYYFHARWYDPQVGRFVGRDTLPFPRSYQICDGAPTSCYDPDGRWGRTVHYDKTFELAVEKKLFYVFCAEEIARNDEYTDFDPATEPFGGYGANYREYHWDGAKAEARFREGCETCDIKLIGQGLHGIQDVATHGRWSAGHIVSGEWPDDEHDERNYGAYALTLQRTRAFLQILHSAKCCKCDRLGRFHQ